MMSFIAASPHPRSGRSGVSIPGAAISGGSKATTSSRLSSIEPATPGRSSALALAEASTMVTTMAGKVDWDRISASQQADDRRASIETDRAAHTEALRAIAEMEQEIRRRMDARRDEACSRRPWRKRR
jgi:hypothetical protein